MRNILTIAESDPSGIKGIEADAKIVSALGGYALTAASSVTQNFDIDGFNTLKLMEPEFVAGQIRSAIGEFEVDAVKIGALFSEEIVDAVSDVIDEYIESETPIVIDPNIIGHSNAARIDEKMLNALKRRLFHKAAVITPNVKEAEAITGFAIKDVDDMRRAAQLMLTVGVENVVLKSDSAAEGKLVYFVASVDEEKIYERDRLEGRGTVGAGNVFSTAIALSLAEGVSPFKSIERAIGLMHQSILHSKHAATIDGSVNFNLIFGHEERYCKVREYN